MRTVSAVAIGICLSSILAIAAPKDNSWDGWISDSKCAAKGGNAGHAACAKKCIEGGEKPVMVTDQDQKVMNIDNPDAVKSYAGQHVKVTGTMANGALHVDKVSALSQ